MIRRSTLVPILLLAAASLHEPTMLSAQEPAARDTAVAEVVPRVPSPAGAMLRSVLVPGWGQAVYGANFRGGLYFAAQTGSWFMLLKTLARLDEARSVVDTRTSIVRADLLARAAQDTLLARRYESPDSLAADVAADPSVRRSRNLVESREQQREDWIAYTLFWTLASAVDAYVNAHLADFPGRIDAEPRPSGGFRLGVTIPAGAKP